MNILFLNNAEISPISNGIQRVTHVLAQGFVANQNARCFSAYFSENNTSPKTEFQDKLLLTTGQEYEQLKAFISKNEITIVICQQLIINKRTFALVQKAISQNKNCQSFYCLHACPTYVFTRPNVNADFFRLIHRQQVIRSLKKLAIGVLPEIFYNALVKKNIQKEYSLIQTYFDKTVLLSESYVQSYINLCGKQSDSNVKFVNNPLSFDEYFATEEEIAQKQEEVIIVSRLSDRQKRISRALQIWKNIENKPEAKNWKLTIIGTGEDEGYYRHLARKLSLQKIHFEGRQDPIPYYKRASICLMTSAYEGWPMNIIEALQTGVVPFTFDSHTAIHDIIENNLNGIIVPNQNCEEYAKELLRLMSDKKKRQEMAIYGIKSCKRYSSENITKQWMKLFQK